MDMSETRYALLTLNHANAIKTFDWQVNGTRGELSFALSAELGSLLEISLLDEVFYLRFSQGELRVDLCHSDLAKLKIEK
jgi:hypothetical protein